MPAIARRSYTSTTELDGRRGELLRLFPKEQPQAQFTQRGPRREGAPAARRRARHRGGPDAGCGGGRASQRARARAELTPLPDGRVRMQLAEGALYVRLAPDALLAWDERGELLARVTDVDGRAALVGGRLSEP